MLTVESLRFAIAQVESGMKEDHERLTALDAQLGDGDLGITLLKAFQALAVIADTLPDDLGAALLTCGATISKVSSSSFGTLMATGLIAAAKSCRGKRQVAWKEVSSLVGLAREAMMARGKANLNDKTVLDSLWAIELAIRDLDAPEVSLVEALKASTSALELFRNKPNKVGRARIYAERSVGLDDPGMAAVAAMLAALSSEKDL